MQVDRFRNELNCALRVVQREEVGEEPKAEDPSVEEWEKDAARWVKVDDMELTATEAVVESTKKVLVEASKFLKPDENDWFEPAKEKEDVEMVTDPEPDFNEPSVKSPIKEPETPVKTAAKLVEKSKEVTQSPVKEAPQEEPKVIE